MKSSVGDITFEHTTVDDKLVRVTATVFFDSFGEPSLDVVSLENDTGQEVEWHSLDIKDRIEIESRASNNATPQDECYDDYEDMS